MKMFLQNLRQADTGVSVRAKVWVSAAIAVSGMLIGVFQKWLDGSAFNELPLIFQQLDLTNYFGRLAVWILIGTLISIYAGSPLRASVNTFLFFICMVTGYYVYCHFVLGFLPKSYMLLWIVLSFLSPLPAYICWYAKGRGMAAVLISSVISGVLFSQAFLITQGFYITHLAEVITWGIAFLVLRRKPKEWALVFGLSIVVAVIYQLVFPYWG